MPYQHLDVERHKKLLGAVNIPEHIKCKVCKSIRSKDHFSKRQLEETRKGVAYGYTNGITGAPRSVCRQCTGSQNMELTCAMCDKTKALSCFSKNQRRDPDNARCTNCIQNHLDTDPVAEENRLMIENETNLESTTYKSQTGDYGLESLRTLSIADAGHANNRELATADPLHRDRPHAMARTTGLDDDEDDGNVMTTNDVWVGLDQQNTNKRGALAYTAYDANGTAHARTAAAPSEAGSVHTGWQSWGIVPSTAHTAAINTRAAHPAGKRNPGFAKIPGARVGKLEGPSQRQEEPKGATIESDESDDDDSDDDPTKWI